MKFLSSILENLNGWTIAGIISIMLTYYFIQKGAAINAKNSKEEIKSRIDTAEINAIESIKSNATTTNQRITESANQIISDLQTKANSVSKALEGLEKEAKESSKKIKQQIEKGTEETKTTVEEEGTITRREIIDSKIETIGEVKKLSPEASGIKFLMNKIEGWTADNSHLDWELWRTSKKNLAETTLKLELNKLTKAEKGLLINFLYKGGLIGNLNTLREEQRKVKGDKNKVYGKYWTHVPIILAYLDFNNSIFEETFWVHGVFMSFMQLNGIKAKKHSFSIQESFLQSTSFTNSILIGAKFRQSKMQSTRWAGANLKNSDFSFADLSGATFSTWMWNNPDIFIVDEAANLEGVNFKHTILTNAKISVEQLKSAKTLEGATMPNGKKYDENLPIEEQVLKLNYVKLKK